MCVQTGKAQIFRCTWPDEQVATTQRRASLRGRHAICGRRRSRRTLRRLLALRKPTMLAKGMTTGPWTCMGFMARKLLQP